LGRGTSLRLRVAGLTLRVDGLPARPPRAALRPFLVGRGADIHLTVVEEPVPRPSRDSLLFHSGGVWSVHRADGGLLYRFRSSVLRPRVYKGVLIDDGRRRGRLFFPRAEGGGRRPHPLEFPLDELLFQHRLAQEGAVELHACGLVVRGRAVLFSGRSGAGKTTTARLWRSHRPGTPVLSDDRVVLRRRGSRFQAFGTPWHGAGGFATVAEAPLSGIFFIRHARRDRAQRLAVPEAAARLFARSFPPAWEAATVARVLETCAEIASTVPCWDFGFRPAPPAIQAVEDALRAGARP